MAYCWKEWDRMNIKVELVHQNIGAGRPDPNLKCNHDITRSLTLEYFQLGSGIVSTGQ